MEAVLSPSPGILLEEYIPILMNFLALLPHLSERIDLPAEARRNVNPILQEDILILMNFLVLLRLYVSGRSVDLLADHAENRWTSLAAITTEMLNGSFRSSDELCALLSDLLSEARRGRAGSSHSCGEGSSSHSEASQAINDGSAVRAIPACEINYPALKNKASIVISENGKNHFVDSNGSPQQREELNRNKVGCSGMTASTSNLYSKAPEIRNDSYNGINSPPGPYVSIDIPSFINQEYEENVVGGLDGRKSNEIHIDRINSTREPYVTIDVPSVVEQQQPDRKKRDNSMISETTLAITAQAVGTLVSSAFSGSSHPSWTANLAAVATVYGIAFTVLGIGLRRVKPKLSGIMEKLGAVVMASAIILALGLTVVPVVAWTTGVVACLIIAFGVAMA